MLGLEGYGSGSDDESLSDSKSQPVPSVPKAPQKPKRTKKITIGLPALSVSKGNEDDSDDLEAERPPAKKHRVDTQGAGASSLLGMLPAPKQKEPIATPSTRVLGGGKGPGLVFNTSHQPVAHSTLSNKVQDEDESNTTNESIQDIADIKSKPLPFLPSSLTKGKSNISLEEEGRQARRPVSSAPTADFFSLSSTSQSRPLSTSNASSATPISSLSSAPSIPTFVPPEPTPTDQYPGYYQLPSGEWAAYDVDYYSKYMKKWQREYDAHVRALEKGKVKGFEDMDSAAIEEIDAAKEMERAKMEIKDREEKKALTKGAAGEPAEPRMKISASKLSGIARSRHQLSTLLKEAYENREALEERIAEGRRNRKEAGNKYGF